jgi:redox-sensing transcriptional repressor
VSHSSRPPRKISDSTVRRLSSYLRLLQEVDDSTADTISSDELARRAGTTSAQVRKDLSFFGSFGKRGLGYSIPELLSALRAILGLTQTWNVAVVGAGKIGSALISYRDFRKRGFDVRAVFDSDPAKVGRPWGSRRVLSDEHLEEVIRKDGIEIVILAVPAEAAQGMLDRLVGAGVKAVLNFAPVRLSAPEAVALRNVDMAMELEVLSYALSNPSE